MSAASRSNAPRNFRSFLGAADDDPLLGDDLSTTDETPRGNGLGLALEVEAPDRFQRERSSGEALGQRTDVGLTGRRLRFETLRDVDRVAEHRVVGAHLAADDERDRVATVDADVQAERLRRLAQPSGGSRRSVRASPSAHASARVPRRLRGSPGAPKNASSASPAYLST